MRTHVAGFRLGLDPPAGVGNQLDDILFAPNGIQAFEYRTLRLLISFRSVGEDPRLARGGTSLRARDA
jgi:hypothetical protein